MEWVETTGRTVEEARNAALEALGVGDGDAEIEVLAEAKTGLFGRIRTMARVRARVRPTAPRPKDERRDRRRRRDRTAPTAKAGSGEDALDGKAGRTRGNGRPSGRTDGDRRGAGRNRPAARRSERADRSRSAESESADTTASTEASRDQGGTTGADRSQVSGPRMAGDSETGSDVVSSRTGRRRSRGRGAPDRSEAARSDGSHRSDEAQAASEIDWDRPHGTASEGAEGMEVALDEQAEVAVPFLEGLVARFGRDAEVRTDQPDDSTLHIDLSGPDLGLLIGPKGTTLLALQDLTRTVVQRRTGADNGRIFVDVGGYRQKRREALGRFTAKVAADVLSSGSRIALEPMSAPDRKVVHDTAAEIEGISTVSEGEEPHRRVVILPEATSAD